MGEVKRYDLVGDCYAQPFCSMDESEDGDYVLHSDYDTLRAKMERLRSIGARAVYARNAQDSVALTEAMAALADACGRKG